MSIKKTDHLNIKHSIDEMYEGIQIIDFDFRYLYINKAAAKQGRSTPEKLIGKTMMECYAGIEKTEMFAFLKESMEKRQLKRMENKFVFDDGTDCWFELLMQPHEKGILIRSLDITNRKHLEFQYWQTQKLDALGKFTSQITHDLNNKFTILSVLGKLLHEQHDLSESSKEVMTDILNTVQDCQGFLNQLKSFIRNDFNTPSAININELIQHSKEQYKKLLPENIKLTYSLATTLSEIILSPSQLEQILLNLVVNAIDAMPNGGTLTIETSEEEVEYNSNAYQFVITSGKYVKLRITDTGFGIEEDILPNIFDPFFSTKKDANGTGIGLSIVHGIVNQSKGFISINTRVGLGAEFNIFFPAIK